MELFNNSIKGVRSVVLDQNLKVKNVFRVAKGENLTTTQIYIEGKDIIVARNIKTNDLTVTGKHPKNDVLKSLHPVINQWLLSDSVRKLPRGYWWDGREETTVCYLNYAKRISYLLRGVNYPGAYREIIEARHLKLRDIPKWEDAKPLPTTITPLEEEGTDYIFVFHEDTSLTKYALLNGVDLDTNVEFPLLLDSISTVDNPVHNIIHVQITAKDNVEIKLFTNKLCK